HRQEERQEEGRLMDRPPRLPTALPPSEVKPDIKGARRLLANNTRLFRRARGLTQVVAAERAGLDHRQWQKVEYEETNATLETLARMAAALDTTIRELFKPLRRR